jgi:hypothetical protein
LAIVGDHTLLDLYGRHAAATWGVESVVAALLVLPGALAARRLGLWRRFVFMSALLGAAGAMVFFAPAWAELMHSREAVNAQAILFHLFWPLAGAGLAVLGFGRAARFPEGMALIGILVLPSGFFINRIEYRFAFDLVGEFGRESTLALAVGAATLLKYGLPLFFALFVYTLQRGRQAALQTFSGLIFLLQLKLIALLAQALLLPLATAEKLYELAVADTAFVFSVLLIVVLTYSTLRISSSLATNRSLSLSILNSLSTRVRPARPMRGHEAGELNSRLSCAARASASRSGTK